MLAKNRRLVVALVALCPVVHAGEVDRPLGPATVAIHIYTGRNEGILLRPGNVVAGRKGELSAGWHPSSS